MGWIWQWYLAGSSKRAHRIFIFSIVLGAENLSYMKLIETHARAFLALIILTIGRVAYFSSTIQSCPSISFGGLSLIVMWGCDERFAA